MSLKNVFIALTTCQSPGTSCHSTKTVCKSVTTIKSVKIIKKALMITLFLMLIIPSVKTFLSSADETQIQTKNANSTNDSKTNVSRYIQYSFTLQNKKNTLIKEADLWAYTPVKKTSTQSFLMLKASYPYELIEDDFKNQIIHFTVKNIAPFETKILTIEAMVELTKTPKSLPKDPERDMAFFLKPQEFIESDALEIVKLAESLKASEPSRTIENIFSWITENIQYLSYIKNDQGALYALTKKRGDCTEFMYLFVALSRASGIPARGIGGYVYTKNSILSPSDYHNWAEFYEDGVWKIADPKKKVLRPTEAQYIAMRVFERSDKNPMGNFNEFQFSGDGLSVVMK